MRSKTRQAIRNKTEIVSQGALEMKNSIVWAVNTTARYCDCKILGSTVNVRAYYPQSWAQTPYWVQRGSPALIRFPTGHHSRIEIFSEGQIIPSPASTLYQFPESTTPINLITSGCDLLRIPNAEQMAVLVKTGKVRIGGDTVELEGIPCNDTNNYACGMGGACGEVHQVCTIASAPSCVGDYRYDVLQVGTDAVVDVLKGTTFRTVESKASAESGHVALADVLLHYGMTEVENMDINRTWTMEEHYHIDATWTDRVLDWGEPSATITIEVLDSYGNPIKKEGYGWHISLEITTGTGSLESTAGTSTSIVYGYTGKNNSDIDFVYYRNAATDNVSPILKAVLHENFVVDRTVYITLYSSAGTVM